MKALIVVDMQNDFIYGSLSTPEAKRIVPNVVKKIEEYRKNDYYIIFTQDTHYSYYLNTQEGRKLPIEHCLLCTTGRKLIKEMKAKTYEIKRSKSTFGTDWDFINVILNRCDEIELIGVCTNICVISNALILKTQYPEIEITIDASCCAGTTPELHEAALKVMQSCQINVIEHEKND